MRNRLKSAVRVVITVVLVTTLAGCSKGGEEMEAGKGVLRIGTLYGDKGESDTEFRQRFTDTFELLNSQVGVEIVPVLDEWGQAYLTGEHVDSPYAALRLLMEGDNPVDAVIVDPQYIYSLIQDNLLQELDPFIQRHHFDMVGYAPAIREGIKAMGNGKMYALTPTFIAAGLFYNKTIFKERGIDPPKDGMDWEEVTQLARRAAGPGEEWPVFGLVMNRFNGNGFRDVLAMARQLDLKLIDESREKMLVNSSQWENLWTMVSELYKDQISPATNDFYTPPMAGEDYNPYSGDLFLSGRAAMLVSNFTYLNELAEAASHVELAGGSRVPDWDVVSVPYFSQSPSIGMGVEMGMMVGINARAQNSKDAWRLIELLNGKPWAKTKSRSINELMVRKEFARPLGGMSYNLEAFYGLQPALPDTEQLSSSFNYYYDMIYLPGFKLFNKVISGEMTVKEALEIWESSGNASLKRIKEEPDKHFSFNEYGLIQDEH
ncbi:ABC transporter substrate-binding protein [Paenibacillus sp. GCM10012307]|uniref:Extracellular solute-binding protein n=1 Tax=Paenibacillus roseus TaxID=2798579 RepID=A0A934MWJ0_9BACL|nr:extracellular solute-binding protein [Paenibacillus roseus]MBJ6363192.1 extracellular solute-binding protein [Paenibacillus roseus]